MEDWEVFDINRGVLKKYHGIEGDVVIPDGVKVISAFAFCSDDDLKTVKIPNGVKRIGKDAFMYCHNLEQITLPETLTDIEEGAFSYCDKLRDITIPKSVKTIGEEMLKGCTELQALNVEKGNPIYHSDGNCLIETETKILLAGCVNSVIPADGSVTCIGDHAFFGCSSLRGIAIPKSVTTIGESAFFGCKDMKHIVIPNQVRKIGKGAFMYCENVESLIIPDSVTEIEDCAFRYCEKLRDLSFGSHLEKPIRNAFPMEMNLRECVCAPDLNDEKQCKILWETIGLHNLMVPFLLETIKTNEIILKKLQSRIKTKKFREECVMKWIEQNDAEVLEKLLSFVKKISVEEIDGYIEKSEFFPEIRTIFLEYKNRLYPAAALDKMEAIRMEKDFGLLEKTLADYRRDFKIFKDGGVYKITGYKSENETIIIPGKIKGVSVVISNQAFSNCEQIEEVLIGEGVIGIGESAFRNCKNLKNIVIPDSVTEIGEKAFFGCTDLADEKGRIVIRDILFGYCGSEADFDIPDGITAISSEAFRECSLLRNIRIPASVKRIGSSIFRNCGNLQSISVSAENPFYRSESNCLIDTVNKVLLAGCADSVIPADGSVTEIGKSAFHWRKNLKNIVIPDGVTTIGDFAFSDCSDLESVKLSADLKRIGECAFYGCAIKGNIEFPDGLIEIGAMAFCMCQKLQGVTIPKSVTNIGLEAFCCFGYSDLSFVCFEGSYAEAYIKKYQNRRLIQDDEFWEDL